MADRTLKDVIDYTSGSSWDGTHDRSIEVSYTSADNIIVDNVYQSHHVAGRFTLGQIFDQMAEARSGRYFSDFCYEAGRKIPGIVPCQDDKGQTTGFNLLATPDMIEAEVKGGVQSRVTILSLRLKPKM